MEINFNSKTPPPVIDSGVKPAKLAGQSDGVVASGMAGIEAKASPVVPEFEKLDLEEAVEELQAFVDSLDRSLSFRRDESIDRSIITVRDANTNQLVRQIPAEEVVEIARQIREDLDAKRAGMLLNGEA